MKIVLIGFALILFCKFTFAAEASSIEREMVAFKSILPELPKICDAKIIASMREIAASKRLDAAILLVKALAYHADPYLSNETLDGANLIPAIGILKGEYGENVVPLLIFEGVSTDQDWLRRRCALALLTIASKEQIAKIVASFSFKDSMKPEIVEFRDFLSRAKLKVEYRGADLLITSEKDQKQ